MTDLPLITVVFLLIPSIIYYVWRREGQRKKVYSVLKIHKDENSSDYIITIKFEEFMGEKRINWNNVDYYGGETVFYECDTGNRAPTHLEAHMFEAVMEFKKEGEDGKPNVQA
jgi:hypothetical protein